MSISIRKIISELADELKIQQEKNPGLGMSEIEANFNFDVDMFIEDKDGITIEPKDPETNPDVANNISIRVLFSNYSDDEEKDSKKK